MDGDTRSLFQRVAGKLGWSGHGGLDSAEKQLIKRIGKNRCPATGGDDPSPTQAVCHPNTLQLSDSDSSGKENQPGNGEHRPDRVQLDSSDDDFDLFLAEKGTPKPNAQQPHCPAEKTSSSVQVVSSDSDSSFENFLSRVKTPKSKPVAAVRSGSDDSLKHFIVNSCSSDDDFVTEKKKKAAPKSASKTPRPALTPGASKTPRPALRRPPSQWDSPVFLSDSDEDEGVVIRSTWKSRHTPRGPRAGGRQEESKSALPAPQAPPSSAPPKQTHRAPPPRGDSGSSEEEFQSLLERLKRNHSAGSKSTQQPNNNRVDSESQKKPSLSVPSGRGLGGAGPRRVEKGVQADRTPTPPVISRPHVSLTEPRATHSSRLAVCKTPGCFLQSLSDPGSVYCRSFKQKKEDLTSRLYQLYNSSVFDNKLPSNMSVTWNKKMRKTAGYCITGQERGGRNRYARIELSEKVCDSADRLRDTLVHEMCHAATWLINGVRDGHGSFWKLYARKATVAHPELPMVTRCHSYDINYKYQYECTRCKNTIGRHSKSLDTQRFVCALCTGQLVLLTPAKPRGATPFASFVKENYGSVRQELVGQSHAEVMRKLSADFASKTRLSQS
ncbi:acidic repeat-containing protein [Megalops cyprinoides]|uniref:acidic repeat-containing protein n=1 Tax=Megalops cyprinoides TaxID=118141 RepID=UPI0018648AB3|nr:acidic repeat-containing protein [Megalops cyprinoides]